MIDTLQTTQVAAGGVGGQAVRTASGVRVCLEAPQTGLCRLGDVLGDVLRRYGIEQGPTALPLLTVFTALGDAHAAVDSPAATSR